MFLSDPAHQVSQFVWISDVHLICSMTAIIHRASELASTMHCYHICAHSLVDAHLTNWCFEKTLK